MTPAQLREASLVPRYDLYQQAFGDTPGLVPRNKFDEAMQSVGVAAKTGARAALGAASKCYNIYRYLVTVSSFATGVASRVIIDEAARSAATIGAQATIQV